MSVQMNTYVMRGSLVPYEQMKGKYDELEPYMDNAFNGIHHHEGICVLFDGMNGKYVAIGQVLAKTKNHQGFDEPIIVNSGEDDNYLRDRISALAGSPVSIGILIISHYR